MELQGHVLKGVVVLNGPAELPEGAVVSVPYPVAELSTHSVRLRVNFPLVRTSNPGTIHLTNDRIAEILDEEDLSARR
jgi:hypothetical protein